RQFFARWPVDLPLDVERTVEELEAVNDDVPLQERASPESKKGELSEEEYLKAKEAYEQYRKDLTTRKRQIESRLKDDYDKAHATKMKGSDKQYLSDLLVELTLGKKKAKGKGKHRKDSAAKAWLADGDNGTRFRKIYDARKLKEKPKQSNVLPLYNKVLAEEFS
ncbi:hypothetical protein V5O48_019596, partial [Marasmius crinis-equi]